MVNEKKPVAKETESQCVVSAYSTLRLNMNKKTLKLFTVNIFAITLDTHRYFRYLDTHFFQQQCLPQ